MEITPQTTALAAKAATTEEGKKVAAKKTKTVKIAKA